ncbi:MAG TPA: porin [Bryobacteraceae bacterium]|nr:porin [Bryobacteraceae bacterium]
MRNPRLALWLFGAFVIGSSAFGQATPPSGTANVLPGDIKVSGLIDGYYSFNANHPATGFNTLRNFEVKSNQFSLNMIKMSFTRAAEPVGFTLDLGYGRAWQIFHATDPAGPNVVLYLPQAYLSLKPKNWGGFQFDFGKFYTSAGAELTENNLTWSYGRGYLYTNGPYYHFGARMTKPINQHFSVGFQLVNGWNNVEDNNSGKTLGVTTAWTGKKIAWYNNYYAGPEKNATNKGWRNFYDTVLNLNPTDKTSVYVNFDYGREKDALGVKNNATWVAIGVAGRLQTTERTAVAVRYENYDDRNGFITGQSQSLNSFTLTGECKWQQGLISRLEYRRDWSDKPFFERGTLGVNKNQSTLTLGFIAWFGS